MIDLAQVGAGASAPTGAGVPVRFGLYLPGIGTDFELDALVIHRADRFDPDIQPARYRLQVTDPGTGLRSAEVTLEPRPGTHLGQAGRYLYRYQLLRTSNGAEEVVTRWFTDPFARATDDVGQLSAFETPGTSPDFTWHDEAWKVPDLDQLVAYELHVEEFNSTFDGLVERLAYLRSLGVTCLELLPVSSLKVEFDWGYGPLHYMAPNERWGGPQGFRRLVDACHGLGIAVILDVVYQHVDPAFPYHLVYRDAGLPSPMIGGSGPFGPTIDYTREFARDYVRAINAHWLREYHVDGFRYDEVTDLYDGPVGVEYAAFAYDVYNESLALPRFTPSGGTADAEYSRVIQVPEAINRPQEILRTTYSTATWQDDLLGKVEDMMRNGYVDDDFVRLLDADGRGYPRTKTVHDRSGHPVDMPVAPFQYLNSHDHSHLVTFASPARGAYDLLADRSPWYEVQPLVIALYTASGVPMLWQGQEVSDNYVLAPDGNLRVHVRRDMHWEYFYDDEGSPLVRLHRILGHLRQDRPELRGRDFFYDRDHSRPSAGVVVYHRLAGAQVSLVALNFSEHPQTVTVPAPVPGTYRELVDDADRDHPLEVTVAAGEPITATVPSHYGYVIATVD